MRTRWRSHGLMYDTTVPSSFKALPNALQALGVKLGDRLARHAVDRQTFHGSGEGRQLSINPWCCASTVGHTIWGNLNVS